MKHLCCEYCGEDFKSMEGRMDHRREAHQAEQYIECQGCGPEFDEETQQIISATCGRIFLRPSHLIEHYEKGKCPYITADEFQAERQHKHIIKQILDDPDVFSGIIGASKAMLHNNEWDEDSDINDKSSSGGVGILDDDSSSAEAKAYETLVPRLEQQNLMDQDVNDPIDPSKVPRLRYRSLSASTPTEGTVTRSMFRRVLQVPTSSHEVDAELGVDTAAIPEDDNESMDGSECSAETIRDKQNDEDNAPSRALSIAASNQASLSSYISNITTNPVSIDWAAVARTRELNASLARDTSTLNSSNLFTARWYDPNSPSYNPDLFWHTILELYKCPFASCGAEFSDQSDMETHLRYTHVISRNKCPTCYKEFTTVAGLVRHFEASVRGSRCWISGTKKFAETLAEVTGGFLDVLDVGRRSGENVLAGYVRTREGMVKVEGQVGGQGVMTKRFEGTRPEGLEERKLEQKGLEGENEKRLTRGNRGLEGVVW
ncbi:Hypothetical protein D9617_6g095230 [Elsinoe fawcettii]|nr:Hypothetical protein D9617_6g095230 [Elsinoe fawcettii]